MPVSSRCSSRYLTLYRSVVGRKIIAAITGIILLSFLLLHAFGNLNNFAGINADGIPAINAYAMYLRDMGTPLVPKGLLLWLVRLLLIAALILHISAVTALIKMNRLARKNTYQKRQHQHTSFATHWVVVSGVLLFVFIIFHISQFTFGFLTPFDFVPGLVYHNLFNAFQHGWLVSFYLLALIALGLHLRHGIWSLCQTLGLDNPDRNRLLRFFASSISTLLVCLFASIPLAFYFGFLDLPFVTH